MGAKQQSKSRRLWAALGENLESFQRREISFAEHGDRARAIWAEIQASPRIEACVHRMMREASGVEGAKVSAQRSSGHGRPHHN